MLVKYLSREERSTLGVCFRDQDNDNNVSFMNQARKHPFLFNFAHYFFKYFSVPTSFFISSRESNSSCVRSLMLSSIDHWTSVPLNNSFPFVLCYGWFLLLLPQTWDSPFWGGSTAQLVKVSLKGFTEAGSRNVQKTQNNSCCRVGGLFLGHASTKQKLETGATPFTASRPPAFQASSLSEMSPFGRSLRWKGRGWQRESALQILSPSITQKDLGGWVRTWEKLLSNERIILQLALYAVAIVIFTA